MIVALTLEQLANHVPRSVVYGSSTSLIDGITEDSRKVRPGSLFVARNGEHSDGRKYVQMALAQGAAAILCEPADKLTVTPRLEVPDLRAAWGILAQKLYGDPSHHLKVVGITGTNGKTTVASLVAQALENLGHQVARAGTLGFYLGQEKISESLTTPMPDQLANMLALALERGTEYAIVEVSSHALAQKRTMGLSFEVTAFTNLSQDHLDYHGSLDAYGAEKERLFSDYAAKARVFNIDDQWGLTMSSRHENAILVSTRSAAGADLFATDIQFSAAGLRAVIHSKTERVPLCSSLLGNHNLENLLVAWGILQNLGFEHRAIARGLEAATGVAGRLERCETELDDIVVVVDYAHTPDALKRVLETLGELNFTRLLCVFGCGGDRDRSKRPLMGRAVANAADELYVTSDNPRTEEPRAIIDDILSGLGEAKSSVHVEPDRRSSIEQAILDAPLGACVLIAGKGHEDYQLIGSQVLAFDDRVEARRALEKRRQRKLSRETS